MATGRVISFANFICKFGTKNLLDVADEIVIPAFLDCESFSSRRYGDTSYFFIQTQLINLGSPRKPTLALAGRFVKDTTLTREQIYDPNRGLIRTAGKLDSSPSALFVLLLNNHKVIYCPETAHSPSLESFRSTAYWYIRQQQNKFVKEEYERRLTRRNDRLAAREDAGERVTKKQVWDDYPIPELEVMPIPSELSLSEFVKRYRQLSSMSLRVLQTNSEIDNRGLLRAVRNTGSKLGARNSVVTHTAGDRGEGLDKGEAIAQLRAVGLDGNVEVKLNGKDASGNKLIGNNEEFKLRAHVDSVSHNVDDAAAQLNTVFLREVDRNNLRLANDADVDGTADKIRRIARARNV